MEQGARFRCVSSMNEAFKNAEDNLKAQLEDSEGLVIRSELFLLLNSIMNAIVDSGWSSASLESAKTDLHALNEKASNSLGQQIICSKYELLDEPTTEDSGQISNYCGCLSN